MRGQPKTRPDTPRAVVKDCWNRIGVSGDGSCPELERFVHCRNCPVYSSAAVTLLDRDSPAGYRDDCTSHFSELKQVAETDTHSVLIFRIGTEWLSLPTSVFAEVAEMRAIHALPHQRTGIVLGIANVRGELLLCVSLGKLLGLGEQAAPHQAGETLTRQRLLVISQDGRRLVFPVDEVHGTYRHHHRDLKETPSTVAKAATTYTKAMLPWQKRTVGCLDDQLVFYALNRSIG